MTKTYALIYNPKAGRTDAKAVATKAQQRLTESGLTATCYPTRSPKDVRTIANRVAADCVVAIGGDGTINQVVSGLAPRKHPPLLGILPAGTVNNLARVLQIPLDLDAAIDNLHTSDPQPLDVAAVNDRYMVSSLTLGVLANAALSVTQTEKRRFGPLIFLLKGANVLAQHQHWQMTLTSRDQTWQRDTQFLLLTVTNAIGGFTNFIPDATPNDGQLHVFVAPKLTLWRSLLAIPYFISGNFQKLPGMTYLATSELTVAANKKLKARIDGDPSTATPLKVQLISDHIHVLAPTARRRSS